MVKPLHSLRTLRYLAIVAVLLTSAAATGWITVEHRRFLRASGLAGEYRAGAEWQGPPDFTSVDNGFSAELVRQRSRERHGAAFTATWQGYLVVPARDRYRFSVLADDRASIEIDKRPVIEGDKTRRESSIELARGLHPITIRYYDGFGLQNLDLRWAQHYGPHDHIPRTLLVPHLISGEEAQRRIRLWRWSSRLPLIWSMTIIGAAAAFLVYRCTFAAGTDRRRGLEMLPIYAIAGAIFITGIWWGLPDYRGWAVDEITPGEVDDIVDHRFATGWATIYPPLHFAVLALASAPMLAADSAQLIDDTVDRYSQLFLIGRMVSVAMALAILAFIYHLTRSELGHRAARFAVTCVLLGLPLTYYAKTANLDVPYLFWVTASWLFYMRAIRGGRISDACLFAVMGAAAIATKDQAYGFYVLPAAHLVFDAFQSRRGDSSRPQVNKRIVFAMAGVSIAALLILFNVPLNAGGVREHFRLIVGPASAPFRMYPSTAVGYAQLLRDGVWQMGSAMSWPLFIIGIIGVVSAIRSGMLLVPRLLLFALSYFLTFITIVMYHYDRFFIGICLVFAIAAGAWLDQWTRAGQPYRRVRLSIAGLAIAYGASRVVTLDAMMLRDSRYYVERWIIDRIGPDTRIAADGTSIYLPRQAMLLWSRIAPDPAALREQRPTFVILNPAYSARAADEEAPNEFYSSLADGSAGYRRVLSYRTDLWLSPLQCEPRFSRRSEDQFSNVTKVNPTIEVYERIDAAATK